MVAVKGGGGPDPDGNPALRSAIQAARAANMPNDRIDRAIKRAAGADGEAENFEEVRYEGYGPGGVALIVESLTDNRNRTAADVRSAFNKFGGSLGETNSVAFMFDRIGLVVYEDESLDPDEVFEAALEAGAEDVQSNDGVHEIATAPDDLNTVRDRPGADVRAALLRQARLAPAERDAGRRREGAEPVQAAGAAGRARRRPERLRQLRHSRRDHGGARRLGGDR